MTLVRLFAGLCLAATLSACTPVAPRAVAAQEANGQRSISWDDALALLRTGRVQAVTQLHDLTVTLTTDDGVRHVTREPGIDAILVAITQYAPNARQIAIATE